LAWEILESTQHTVHQTHIAELFGARLAVASENEAGMTFKQWLLKLLSGGGTETKLSARRMHQDPWKFERTAKIWLSGNYKPRIKHNDEALFSRLKLIPFLRKFAKDEQDPKLGDKLVAELPGILNWAIAGCLAWQQEGAGDPPAVTLAVEEYQAQEDHLGRFIAEVCVCDPQYEDTTKHIYAAYKQWCEAENERPMASKTVGTELERRGFKAYATTKARLRKGISADEHVKAAHHAF
jgi:putative DNA primase/helicase